MEHKKTGLPLFKLFGFEVRLDWSWFFLAILIAWTLAAGYFPAKVPNLSKAGYWSMGVVGAALLFLSVILHEVTHAVVGKHYGLPIAGIKLFIFGGVAEMNDEPPTPKAEFMMAISGPLCSIFLGFLFNLLFKLGQALGLPIAVNAVISYLSLINFVLGFFNLLPGFPMDGGRVLRSLLWWWKGDRRWATQIAATGGVALGFTMVFLGILALLQGALIVGIWTALLGFFIQFISKMSYQQLLISEFFHGQKIRKYAKTDPITAPSNISVQDLVDNYFYKYYHKIFPVLEQDNLVGYVTFADLRNVPVEKWRELKVAEVMQKCPSEIVLDANVKVMRALQIMNELQTGRIIVVDHGKLYGIVTLKDLMNVISFRMNLDKM